MLVNRFIDSLILVYYTKIMLVNKFIDSYLVYYTKLMLVKDLLTHILYIIPNNACQ